MSDRPALGTTVTIRGTVVGFGFATDSVEIETPAGIATAPLDSVIDDAPAVEPPDAEAKWLAHRNRNVARGLNSTGISKRDFMAGLAAAA